MGNEEQVMASSQGELTAWFGIEEAILQYSNEIDRLPAWLALDGGLVIGFVCFKQHSPFLAEIYVMGILPKTHRRGIDRKLINLVEEWLKNQGVEYLHVKTLGPSQNDENYPKTREFYTAMGFRYLEIFTQIWDEHNPCLILVKKL